MCTVTLEYKNTALARRKIAALLATGLFVQKAMERPVRAEIGVLVDEMETPDEHRQLIEAFYLTSRRSMAELIARHVE